jgi:DNA-binding transcriptional regulator YiaG
MKPDATLHNPDPEYISALVESTGLSQPKLGRVLGATDRQVRRWISGETPAPYVVQFALECLVLNP